MFSSESEEFKKDHIMIHAFLKTLDEYNPQLSDLFKKKQLQIYENNQKKVENAEKKRQLFDDILAEHTNPNAELFKHILNHGIKLLDEDEKEAFQMLERAALLSPQNAPLYVFIAEKFFNSDKFSEAKKYLERIFQHSPTDFKVILLLGAIYADEGEAEKARRLLSVLANNEKTALIVDYIWGMLAAAEHNWTESIAAFKESLAATNFAELYYLIGCAYYQTKNYHNALKFLKNAAIVDPNYPDAWFMQAIIYRKLDDSKSEFEVLEKAKECVGAGGQCLEFLKGKKQPEFEFALPFMHLQNSSKRIFINGALRLSKLFREMIRQIIED